MNFPNYKIIQSVYFTLSFMVLHECLNAQTTACSCPAGTVAGPNLIVNGDFSAGNTGFTNDFVFFTAGTATDIGKYSVLNSTQVFAANSQWACIGNTTGTATDPFLVCDGYGNSGPTGWRQTVTTVTGGQYKFCFVANNLVIPTKDYADPVIEVWVNGARVAGPINLPEIPDAWVPITASWSATTTSAIIEIRTASTENIGNDFAIDNITLTRCSNCAANFTYTNIGNCGNFQFANTSVVPGIDRPSYSWTFNDPASGTNNTSILQNPTHQFSTCGTYNVCTTVTSSGCNSTICFNVTVTDKVNPVARCKPGVGVVLNANCQYTVTTAFVDNGSTDDCLLKSLSVNPTVLTGCGNTIVTLTATDWCNNTSTCTMGIQTIETVPPTIVCPPNTSVTCTTDTIPSVTGTATATDNCPGAIMISHSDVVTGTLPCDGTIRRTWTAQDACGNTATCVQTIFVRDNVPPIITCRKDTTVLANQLPCSKQVNGLQFASVTDNCSTPSVTYVITGAGASVSSGQTNASSLIFNSGTSTVTYTATDLCGNKSTCSFNVTVFCDTARCVACPGGISGPNLVTNGTFSGGNAGFSSDLVLNPTPPNFCVAGYYGINTSFDLYCISWHPLTGNGPYLIIDGKDNGGVTTLWKEPVSLTAGKTYCFSFRWASVYDSASQKFPVRIDILNAFGVPITAGMNVTIAETPERVWMTSSVTFINIPPGAAFVSISQLTGDQFRDFGIDDICMRELATCTADASIVNNGCGKYTFTGFANGTGLYTYSWTFGDPLSGINNTSTLQSPMHQFVSSGPHTVTLTITDAANCTATYSFTVNVPVFPTVNLTPSSQSVCSGSSVTLTAVGNGAGTYVWTPGGQMTAVITVIPTILNNTYGITYTDANGCTATASVTIAIKPLPAVIIPNITICQGGSTTLTASDGGTYLWSPGGQATASINVTPSLTTVYSVAITATNGCTGTSQATVTVNPKPNLGNDIVLPCNGFVAPTTYNFGTSAPAGFWGFIIPGPANASIVAITGIASNMTSAGVYSFFLTTNDDCKDTINITIPFCDTCRCGSFSNFFYRPSQGAASQPKVCGDTLGVACNAQFSPVLTGLYTCNGQCMSSGVTWELRKLPNNTPIQTGQLGTNFSLPLLASYFTSGGFYELTLRPQCGGFSCPICKFTLKVDSCCCQSIDQFNQNVQNFATFSINGSLCKATVKIGNLPSCDVVQYVEWGDNTPISAGSFPSGSMPMHTYSGTGIYVISVSVVEQNNGVTCFSKLLRDTIRLVCPTVDTCRINPCVNQSWQTVLPASFVQDMVVYNGKLIVAGSFILNSTNNIAAWDGTAWTTLGTNSPNGAVYALAVHNGLLYAGGSFTSPGMNIAVWNGGPTWSPVGTAGINGPVNSLLSLNSTELVVGGLFTSASSTLVNNIVKWDGSIWSALGSGTNGKVSGLGLFNGDLIAGGVFSSPANNIAKWNGAWSPLGGGVNLFSANKGQGVSAILQLNSTELVVGGRFMDASGVTNTPFIAKWNGSWNAMSTGVNTSFEGIYDLKIYGGQLYAGGLYTQIGSSAISGVARWNGSNWVTTGHTDRLVRALAVYTIPNKSCDLYSGGEVFLNHLACSTPTSETNQMNLNIIPNPNLGTFTVELQEGATSNMKFRITDITGRLIQEYKTDTGNKQQTVLANNLGSGMYFLQVITDGKVLAVEKFVKQ